MLLYWWDAANEYLDELHTTLWGRAWDVNDPKTREEALDNLWGVIEAIEEKRKALLEKHFGPLRPVGEVGGMKASLGSLPKDTTVTFNQAERPWPRPDAPAFDLMRVDL